MERPSEHHVEPPRTPRQYVSRIKGTITCADCGASFKGDRAFQEHRCEEQQFSLDYHVGTNIGVGE